jgi:hypothetical protein
MSEDKKVLISRTRVNQVNWHKLKSLAEILSAEGEIVTREDLLDSGLDATVKYYERKLNIKR